MSREFIDFAREHEDEDTARLLLSASRYPAIDMPAAVQQIEGLRAARHKWPSLPDCADYLYPPRLNREQASSEATALYKATIISPFTSHLSPFTVADLTGGMGIDTVAFARVAQRVDYVERDPQLCSLMEHNLKALDIANVAVHCADSLHWLQSHPAPSTSHIIYLDPARRAASGRKVAAFEDCSPDILACATTLRQACKVLMVKASPMIDIDLAVRQLGDVAEVHVVALRGECKEVLFLCREGGGEPQIHCVDLPAGELMSFTRSDEAAAEARYCSAVGRYLYEPCAALMKGGPFRLLAQRWAMPLLAPNSRLYTSDTLHPGFPGRTFEVLREISPSRKAAAAAVPGGKAHVLVRNYPVAAAELQRRMGLAEGGDLFVVATTVGTRRTAFLCGQISETLTGQG